jgi:hypothetical protein
VFFEEFQDRGFLCRIKFQPGGRDVLEELAENEIVIGKLAGAGQEIVEGQSHGDVGRPRPVVTSIRFYSSLPREVGTGGVSRRSLPKVGMALRAGP